MQIRLALTVPETKDADKADTSLIFSLHYLFIYFPASVL